jgi:hypothetical protein
VIAAVDFFTVTTLSFRTLYCFFAIEHGRRRILHFNATIHPTSDWIVQQLREAFPLPCHYKYVLFDRDAKFGKEVNFCNRVISSRSALAFAVPGRTELPNVGWAALVANCSITSFR